MLHQRRLDTNQLRFIKSLIGCCECKSVLYAGAYCIFDIPWSGNFIAKEIFANPAILLSDAIFDFNL